MTTTQEQSVYRGQEKEPFLHRHVNWVQNLEKLGVMPCICHLFYAISGWAVPDLLCSFVTFWNELFLACYLMLSTPSTPLLLKCQSKRRFLVLPFCSSVTMSHCFLFFARERQQLAQSQNIAFRLDKLVLCLKKNPLIDSLFTVMDS